MKLYILSEIEIEDTIEFKLSLWDPWYDTMNQIVVSAPNELQARQLAASNCGSETKQAWLNNKYSTCVELKACSINKVHIISFQAS